MNALERRRMIKSRVIDVSVAKTTIEQSRRERADAARGLRKALAASRYAAIKAETVTVSMPEAHLERVAS